MSNDPNPGILLAVTPILVLVASLAAAVALFGDGTTGGPGQIALMTAGIIAGLIGVRFGNEWPELEKAAAQSISRALPAIFILLMVGTLVGVWMLSGTVPFLIYWGLAVIAPEIFYAATLVICSVVALSIGSSWTTAGTVGVALIGIAAAAGLSVEITAGAIISGAYFGDKASPLSDSTNLAAAVSETELFDHIRFLLWTTVPAIVIAFVFFLGMSLAGSAEMDQERIRAISTAIEEGYSLSPWAVVPALVTLTMAVLRQPAFLSLLGGILAAVLIALLLESNLFPEDGLVAGLRHIWEVMATGYVSNTGYEPLDNLLSRGGMESMLGTVWLILSAMFFGGMMEKSGSLAVIVSFLLKGVDSGAALMRRAGLTALSSNLIASDQYLSIVLPAQMYRDEFREQRLTSRNLSRVLEDYGTTTSVLVPWNTCGAFMAATLGVGTLAYLPYCVFNFVGPIISHAYTLANFKVESMDEAEALAAGAVRD